ncbi:hypothetical protein FIBSPDRAFT_963821 [Athelia psychrophila]|uniref:Uncharacterized protein n=1 Tax=Athelia psychrophila TaxID=1759441 RepID=A0A165YJF3_9AGAM|nr:hypothetical protein FIBSPDRAFT_963821 [Fibularhizoctonia sp. CBS 109695]
MEVTGTWYDHEVRPFGRAVATWLQSEAEPHYGHVLLENLCRMVETFVLDTGSTAHVMAIKDMMLDGNPSIGSNHIQNCKVQVIK